MSYKLCLGLFLILAVSVLESADDKRQSQDLDLLHKFSGVARGAENSNSKKKNEKKTKKIKRKRSWARRKKEKAKMLRANKKEGERKMRTRKNKIKRKMKGGKKKKERKVKGGKRKKEKKRKGGKKKKERKRNKNGKIMQKGKKRGDKEKNRSKIIRKKSNKNNKYQRNKSNSTVSAECYSQSLLMMKIWKDVVSNFKKQNARMKSQNKTGGSKSDKKGLFAPIAFKLIDIGGGNRANLSCGGVYGSAGAKQLANLTKTLFDCEQSVNTSCNTANFPQPNTTFIEACESGITSFETEGKACLKKVSDVTAACECFTSSSFTKSAEAVRDCDASKFSAPIKAQLNKCKAAFSKCRKFEDDAVDALSACTKTQQQHTKKVLLIFWKI